MNTLYETITPAAKEAVAGLLGMKPNVGMDINLREIEAPGNDYSVGDATDAYLKYMGSKFRVILIEVRNVYGKPTIYPVNEAARLLADIAGTKTLTNGVLGLAERMGFAIKEVSTQKTKYGMADELKEIDGMLNAYRNGWISYDADEVARLKARRNELTSS